MEITELKVLGKLPDPFLRPDGSRVSTEQEWAEQRKELYKSAVELQYGTMPPDPEFLEVEMLYDSSGCHKMDTYRIITGTHKKPVSFTIKVIRPTTNSFNSLPEKLPVVICGDGCFNYIYDTNWVSSFINENIILVIFNRVELAHDVKNEGRRKGPLYNTYPDYTFGALGAWAWAYSRVIDALSQFDFIDMDNITVTGHSRGGKAVMLAGAVDSRIAITNPNETCAGGCGCYRIHMDGLTKDGQKKRSETLKDIWSSFDYWFGPDLGDYAEREEELPFDSHYLKALVAPRILFVSEAVDDIWANPVGSLMTTQAAAEVYKFLGSLENLYWYFRPGYHYHKVDDLKMLINLIKHKTEGRALDENFFKAPFPEPAPIYDWTSPENI